MSGSADGWVWARLVLWAALIAPLVACATTTGGTQLQADLDALQQQVWKLQKDNAALTLRLAPGGPAAAQPPDAATAELRARLDSLERDVQALHTRSDESAQRLASVESELRATREALETVARTQGAAPAPPAGAAAPAGQVAGPPATALATAPAPAAGPPASAPGTAMGVELYRLGYSDYAKGNYDLALAELQDFARLNPSDDLADDAQYLIGEILFNQQKYPDAIAAYDRLLSEHAASDKAAGAFLKKGLALLELNRTADAVIQLQHVVSAYPKSEEARLARERLRAMGLRER